jgi:hypothetical protein
MEVEMKRVLLPGVVIGVLVLVAGMILSYVFMFVPSVASDYSNTDIMRSWADPLMMLFLLYPFILGMILSWTWDRAKILFHGSRNEKAMNFGLALFLIVTVPGMFITYTSLPYSFMTVFSWTVGGLVNALIAGFVLVKMNE